MSNIHSIHNACMFRDECRKKDAEIEREQFERVHTTPQGVVWNSKQDRYEVYDHTPFSIAISHNAKWQGWQSRAALESQAGNVEPVAWVDNDLYKALKDLVDLKESIDNGDALPEYVDEYARRKPAAWVAAREALAAYDKAKI